MEQQLFAKSMDGFQQQKAVRRRMRLYANPHYQKDERKSMSQKDYYHYLMQEIRSLKAEIERIYPHLRETKEELPLESALAC